MASFKDILPSQQGWIHELARGEMHPDADRLLELAGASDPRQRVEESTIDLLTELRENFNEYSRTFNIYSENSTKFQEIKIYNLAQTAADFMMFRNQIKLVVCNSAHGVIQLAFSQHARGTMSVDGMAMQEQQDEGRHWDLIAQVGPFRDVQWTFQGEKVTAEQVAKFFFAEFARATRDTTRRSKAGNQVLLDQIKALLQEKGLDL